tara:strand:- start:313 stop:534 length:222 start_codon:yes stop_codon:yes gene_type:complete
MFIRKNPIICLDETDLKEESKNKDLSELTLFDFNDITGEMINKSWYIDFTSDNGFKVFKNRSSFIPGFINKFQ